MEVDGCPLPDDLLYHFEFDEWVRLDGAEGQAVVGIMAPHSAFIGKVSRVTFRSLEEPTPAGFGVAMVESVRYVGLIRMPVEGTVIDRNPELSSRPKWVNDSPYGRGWVFRVQARDPGAWQEKLEPASAIREQVAQRIRERRIRCFPAVPDLELIEVGAECAAILARLDDELSRLGPNDVILLVSDDPTSPIEMERWADRTGHSVLSHRAEGSLHQFLVRKEPDPRPRRRGRG